MIKKLNVWYRTYRYQVKNDIGGMSYIKNNLKPGDTAFDIGAHKGGYLNLMRKCIGKQGTVVGFEPQALLYNYLHSVKKSLDWTNVVIEHLALSDKEGESDLYIPVNKIRQDSSPGASLLPSKSEGNINRTEKVTTQTLDNYLEQSNLNPVLIKIDVEGNELNVLKGGIKYLKSARPKLLVEIEARHVGKERVLETFAFLRNLNYTGRFICRKELFDLDEFSFAHYQNLEKMEVYCNNFVFE